MTATTNTIQTGVDAEKLLQDYQLERLRHMVVVIDFMVALEAASHYEDWDPQGWQERARDLGITREDMRAFRESEGRIAAGKPLPF